MSIINKLKHNSYLAISIGIVYIWFGTLKFFPHLSPAEDLAIQTIEALTFGIVSGKLALISLAILETFIGLGLILNVYRKAIIWIALGHMVCTFAPLFLFPELSFSGAPFCFTLVGQYIMKNIIIIGALLSIDKKIRQKEYDALLTEYQKSSIPITQP